MNRKIIADLANTIARDIISEGDGPTPCHRIQFMGGRYPEDETGQGGFCESALAKAIEKSLLRYGLSDEPTNTKTT